MKKAFYFTFIVIFVPLLGLAQPTVVSFTPTRNALNIEKNTNITVTFSTDIDQSTINNSTIKINGSLSGSQNRIFSYNSSTYTATIYPSHDFQVGELVTVILTRGIKTTGGDSLRRSYAWSFSVKIDVKTSSEFVQVSTLNLGGDPYAVTVGDFNTDGYLDLAVSLCGPNIISILFNNGNGTFTQSSTIGVMGGPWGITTGDFNSDGYLDLAVACTNSDSIAILLNNGHGAFTLSSKVPTEDLPASITMGDFNNDGYLDLAVYNMGSGTVSILLNNGSGAFTQSSTVRVAKISGGLSPTSFIAVDFNGDGYLDLAVASPDPGCVSILLNNGNGIFTKSETLIVGDAHTVTAGDFNGDGSLDLAVAVFGTNTVSIFLNNGNGSFTNNQTVYLGGHPTAIIVGDFNGDGSLDLAVTSLDSNTISVLTNNGNGTFTQSSTAGVETYPFSLISGDFSGNGYLDFAVANSGSKTVSILSSSPGVTGIQNFNNSIPTYFMLSQNYPNPFNPATTIQYGLPARSSVRLVIYNVLGQVVKELVNTEQQAGYKSVVWNANVSSGLYFYRLEAISTENPLKRFIETKKMLLLK